MTSTINMAQSRLEAMHKEGVLTFNEKLLWLAYAHGAFDNFNRLISANYHREGKSSNSQIGTAALVREDTPYLLPQGTTMASSGGIPFEVIWFGAISTLQHKCLLLGALLQILPSSSLATIRATAKLLRRSTSKLRKDFYIQRLDGTWLMRQE